MDERAKPGGPVAGEIVAHCREWHRVRVRLAGGQEVEAVIPKTRKFGCLFGEFVGWQVQVVLREPPKMPRR